MVPVADLVEPAINVARNATCRQIVPFGTDTSCKFISNWTGATETDDEVSSKRTSKNVLLLIVMDIAWVQTII